MTSKLATVKLGPETVRIYTRTGTGGEGYFRPEDGGTGLITIGLDGGQWSDCLGSLLHELLEWTCDRLRCRLRVTNSWSGNGDDCRFAMTHSEFSEATERVAETMVTLVPLLAEQWKRHAKRRPTR